MNMNKRGVAASSTPVIWSVIIVGIILALGMFLMTNSINTNANTAADDLKSEVDADLDAAVSSLQGIAIGLQDSQLPTADSNICDNVDGCNGWRLDSSDRWDAIDRVIDELTDDDNRDLFRAVEGFYGDLEDNDDITSVELHKIGKIRANEELDSDYDLSDSLEIYGEFVLEIRYDEDGSGDSNREFVKVRFVLNDLEDGIDSGELKSVDIVEWDRDSSLNSN